MLGLSVDTDILYAGMNENNNISHYSVEDLRYVDTTPLNSPYIAQENELIELKSVSSLFIVLFIECTMAYYIIRLDKSSICSFHFQASFYFLIARKMNYLLSWNKLNLGFQIR